MKLRIEMVANAKTIAFSSAARKLVLIANTPMVGYTSQSRSIESIAASRGIQFAEHPVS